MTLFEYYTHHASNRGELKPIEDYNHPPLFWCEYFHIHDADGNKLVTIDGCDMTDKIFDKLKDFEEFKPQWCGGDYMHHSYWKPPTKENTL